MSDADEFTQVEAPRRPSKIPRFVTEEELDLICAAIESDYEEERSRGVVQEGSRIWVIPLFRLAFVTGMRAGELARLRWNDIDFEEGLIYIKVQKNRREQTIPLTSAARSILESVERGASDDHVFSAPGNYRQERNVHEWVNRLGAAFRAARVLAGIDRRITVHGLRHGFCTTLAQRGKSAFVIMAAARHSDISTTARYVEYANRHLAKELEEVFSIR
jgi:integrase